MDYQGALQYINSFADYEKLTPPRAEPFKLGRIQWLLAASGNPHLKTPTFHVAGTKGKGSTAAMVASILQAQGYRVGLFTSPHLHSFRERIRVDSQPISQEEMAALVERGRPQVEALQREGSLGRVTTFELLTLLAFLHFAASEVDFQVVEVGLGGRLDTTNVVKPLLAILTSISLDHTAVLGPTLRQVAAEKAGIIKPGSVVVSAPQASEVEEVVRRTCREQGARLVMLGEDVRYHRLAADLEGQSLCVETHRGESRLWIPLLGSFQCENAALAVAAAEEARSLGVQLTPEAIAQGLRQVSWPGRMQVLRRRSLLVVDGAHNVYSATVLRQTIQEDLTFRRCILVVGVSQDKDIPGIAQALGPLADAVVATQSHHPRASPSALVAREFAHLERETRLAPDVPSALAAALELASGDDLVLVTGSLFVVAEALEWAGLGHPD